MAVTPESLVPMHSLEAEMSALGSMMRSERAAEEVVAILNPEDFYRPAHREIFLAMRQLLIGAKPVDIVTLKDELVSRNAISAAGGVEYLVQIMESVPSAANASHYADIVKGKATLRQLEDAAYQIGDIARSPDGDVDEKVNEAERVLLEVGSKRLGKDFVDVRSLAKDFFVDVDNIIETGKPILGTPTKFYDLDEMTTGFYPGDLTIVAARPSMGKTALVLNFALNVAKQDVGNVAIFSLEMGSSQLVRRFASMISGVTSHALRRTSLSHEDYRKLADACEVLYGLPIYIDDTSDISAFEMRGKCRRLKQDGGLSLIMVDYLQLMRGNRRTENRVQEISDIVRSLKALAKELQVPVVALSQLNRSVESREDKRPQLSDIRESGSIEAEADVVMMIYREAYYKAKELTADQPYDPERVEESEIIIAKHRNGPTGKVLLGFQPSYARFLNLKQ
ncbi:MAG: replicative DNA helicase [Fimbriimonadaceae bacterium]|nr:replicative DNA helicase [Chthonomonadaceae bacterium]MCO5296879.1 replicative DNA helicase [Fimbriimonadaceae bacterium]